jgi:hypothetical protein
MGKSYWKQLKSLHNHILKNCQEKSKSNGQLHFDDHYHYFTSGYNSKNAAVKGKKLAEL